MTITLDPPLVNLTDAQTLRAMAAHIRVHGLAQGAFEDDEGATCIMGAALAVQGDDPQDGENGKAIPLVCRGGLLEPVALKLNPHARPEVDGYFEAIAGYNDQDGRTAEEVATFLEGVAADLEIGAW